MAASHHQQDSELNKSSSSKDLMEFPMMNASLRSKLMLSEQARKAKGPPKIFKVGKSSGSLDIENVEHDHTHVEMNLALVENDYDDSSESESESSEEEGNDNEEMKMEYVENGSVTEDNLVIKKSGKKPVIEILQSDGCSPATNNNDSKTKKSAKGRSRSSSHNSPSRKGKKSGKKSRSPSPSAKSKKPVDLLSPDAMVNGYYISHNAEQFLGFRGFGYEGDSGKKKKKGKGKKKKKK
ncbi:hypothetical protein QZH41_011060 [Actinostola sp. cb2023]|nr:hypothetical protein QZH41_011060 [Actinostola sp. cb2023]